MEYRLQDFEQVLMPISLRYVDWKLYFRRFDACQSEMYLFFTQCNSKMPHCLLLDSCLRRNQVA